MNDRLVYASKAAFSSGTNLRNVHISQLYNSWRACLGTKISKYSLQKNCTSYNTLKLAKKNIENEILFTWSMDGLLCTFTHPYSEDSNNNFKHWFLVKL